eukprot:UN07352
MMMIFRDRYVRAWDALSLNLDDKYLSNAILPSDDPNEKEFAREIITQSMLRLDKLKSRTRKMF